MKMKVSMTPIDLAAETQCPIARAGNIFGDVWSLLVLRELSAGNHRFDEIQAMTGATPQMVATRLKKLEMGGLVERKRYNERPARYEYHLTDKGADVFPILMAMRAWGEKWMRLPGEEPSIRYTHDSCGQPAGLGPLCDHCGQLLRREDLTRHFSPAAIAEREARREAHKGRAGASGAN
jgi:DNA-binding HxlR family transcriptional regulator